MRVAALWVPDFPLQALRRSQPELAEAPLAIVAGPSPRDVVVAVAAEAAELGVRRGMTAAQARQVAPETLVRVTPAETVAAAEEALADVAASFSPRIRRHEAGEALLDIGGLVPRFGDEQAIVHALLRACHHVGLGAKVGIASNVGVVRVAARCAGGHEAAEGVWGAGTPAADSAHIAARTDEAVVVRAGQEPAFMAALSVRLLDPAPTLAETLSRWGIRTAGELARLPRREVALRLGLDGVALHRLASGEETSGFVPDPLKEALREGVELDFPLGEIEPFLFVAHGILSRLDKRLELRGEGFAAVLFELRLEDGGRRDYRLKLVAPTREVAAVLAMARLQLEASPPGAPVEGVTAQVTPGRVQLSQGSLFGPPLPAPGRLSMTLARLAALVGPERVGVPAVPDTHRPGAWAMQPFSLQEDRGQGPGASGRGYSIAAETRHVTGRVGERTPDPGSLTPVLRAFRPPREARVDAVDGRPVVVWVGERGGIVVGLAGPYRFTGEWWSAAPFARDDFDVATTDGSLLRVFFDRSSNRWFADGAYD